MNTVELFLKIQKIEKAIDSESDVIYNELGISTKQLLFLAMIDSEKNVSMSSVVYKLNISRGVVSRMLKALVNKNLIKIKPSEGDKRVKLIRITPEGSELLDNAVKKVLFGIKQRLKILKKHDIDSLKQYLKE